MRAEAAALVRRTAVRTAVGALLIAAAPVGAPRVGPSFVPTACAAGPGPYTASTPWPQKLLQADAVRTLSEGEGQLVAVLASGIDVNNAQFAPGQVTAGHDALGGGDPHADCDGRGTFAAGLVGAQPQSSTTFAGLAPGVRLDPIRVAQTFDNADNTAADPNVLATGVTAAIADHATVILVAVPAATSSAALQAAVASAVAQNIVVVSPAAAGQPTAAFPNGDPTPPRITPQDVAGAPVSKAEAISGLPVDVPRPATVPSGNLAVCAIGAGSGQVHLSLSSSLPRSGALTTTSSSSALVADQIFVAPGSGAFVSTGGTAATPGALYLVTDAAAKYPVVSVAAAQALGYGSVRPTPVVASILALLPTGVPLDPAAATQVNQQGPR